MRNNSQTAWTDVRFDKRLGALGALFFVSGFSALVLQTVWTKILSQVIGIDYASQVVVVSIFMLGLGLGALLGGWVTRVTRHSLLFFAGAEVAIALFATSSDSILRAVQPFVAQLSGGGVGLVWDFAIYSAILLPAITLMGSSLPIVVHAVRERLPAGVATGYFYGINVVGAVVGCFATGLLLAGAVGLRGSLFTAAVLSFVAAGGFLAVLWAGESTSGGEAPHTSDAASLDTSISTSTLLLLSFLTGFVALGLEVFYFRVLTFFFGATSYVFPIALGCFLIHIAVGSVVAGRWLRRGVAPAVVIGRGLLASSALLSVPFVMAHGLSLTDPEYGIATYALGYGSGAVDLAKCFLISFVAMVAVSALSTVFPAIVAGYSRSSLGTGTVVGRVYLVQTLGNFSGALLTGGVVIPAYGILVAVGGLALLIGLSCLVLRIAVPSARLGRRAVAGVAVCVIILLIAASPLFYSTIRFRGQPPARVSHEQEGVVLVHPQLAHNGQVAGYRLNVGAEAATGYNVFDRGWENPVWPMDGLLAALGRPPQSVLVVGLGTGDLALNLRRYFPEIKVTIVELLDTVIAEMRDHGSPEIKRLIAAADVHIMDGARFVNRVALSGSPPRYDIIQVGVFHATSSGSGNLFTREFAASLQRLLSPDGVLSFNAYAPVVKGVGPLFPTVWVASRGPLSVSDLVLGNAALDGPALGERYGAAWRMLCDIRSRAGVTGEAAMVPNAAAFIIHDRSRLKRILAPLPEQTNDRVVTENFLYWPTAVQKGWDPRFYDPADVDITGHDLSGLWKQTKCGRMAATP